MTELDLKAVQTYRYLRIGMVLLVVGLFAAVAAEWRKTGYSCFQTSISAYYYTPAQAVFVAALVAIGVCLVVIKGNTRREDVLLDVAGALAPVVAFVPTPYRERCYSVRDNLGERASNVTNNVSALLAVAVVAVAVVAVLGRIGRARGEQDLPGPVGTAVAAVVVVVVGVVFRLDRELFVERAHYTAAIAMFGCIVAVVVGNALGYARTQATATQPMGKPAWANRYLAVAAAMVLGSLGIGAWWLALGWDHAVLGVESTLVLLFAVFWVLQTVELWDQVQRPESASPSGAEPPTDR